jgi:hypothetical protein
VYAQAGMQAMAERPGYFVMKLQLNKFFKDLCAYGT